MGPNNFLRDAWLSTFILDSINAWGFGKKMIKTLVFSDFLQVPETAVSTNIDIGEFHDIL
jgi:hypothetical protein